MPIIDASVQSKRVNAQSLSNDCRFFSGQRSDLRLALGRDGLKTLEAVDDLAIKDVVWL